MSWLYGCVVLGFVAIAFGCFVIADANSAIHEIEGLLSIGFGVLTVATAQGLRLVVEAVERLRPAPPSAPNGAFELASADPANDFVNPKFRGNK